MYVDQSQKDLIADTTDKDGNPIKDIHAMDYNEALTITGTINSTNGIRNTGEYYWLASLHASYDIYIWIVGDLGDIICFTNGCLGIRPVVTMTDGVYIKSGTGTEANPYILGKDE